MLVFKRFIAIAATFAVFAAVGGLAFAADGQPSEWQLGLQQAATPVMDAIRSFHNLLLYIITAIAIFVLALLVIVMVRFNSRANPNPSRTTHNTVLEILWTVVPVLILVTIAVPSFKLLFLEQNIPPADVTVKATGKQWYWSYSYPDNGNFEFDSMLAQDRQPRLLAVENPIWRQSDPSCTDNGKWCGEMVVPVNKVVRVLTTGADVIHSFAVPSFGIKIDAVPGRINETWFKAEREGIYYGQCSELCGKDHAFMPIAVRVVSDTQYAAWLDGAKKQFAAADGARPTALAAAENVTVK
jgi:cytochrome c oxidase subunit 2